MRFRDIQMLLWILPIIPIAVPVFTQTSEHRLSAREIFYSAPTQATAKKPAQPPVKSDQRSPGETAKSKSLPPASGPGKPSGNIIPVSLDSNEAVPLGLRYSILRQERSGAREVDPEAIFHSGDRIRLRVDVNTAGYLYIISRGSSGNWKPLFPSSEIAGGDNHVRKETQYDIPSGYFFVFDEQPGSERLFVIFSRQPVTDLEELIYSLSKEQKAKPQEPIRPDGAKMLVAQANINDNLVNRLRGAVYSRDLIIEKVDETSAPPPSKKEKEKAIYVVNPSRSADARVIADVTLTHE